VRTSSQAPFLVKAGLCYLFDLDPQNVQVFCERVGGGFGGKQEMLTEDICVFAALKTGSPVMLEFTREEEFTGATTRHPMNVHVKAGARRDGTLTALQMRVVSNTGAYGNHGGETLYHGCGDSIGVYRCPNKRVDGYTVYTNITPSGAFRGYGIAQPIFAVESSMDELARALEMDPTEFRLRNVVKPGDPVVSYEAGPSDVEFGSYGLDQCLNLVRDALNRGEGTPLPEGDGWVSGKGIALSMLDCAPPTEHRSQARIMLGPNGRYEMATGAAEFGNGTTTMNGQIAATVLGTTASNIHITQGDTDTTGYDTGAFASAGTTVAAKAVELAATALRDRLLAFAAEQSGVPADQCRLEADAVVCGATRISLPDLHAASEHAGRELATIRKASNSPRTAAFNVQGFRVAVQESTGQIRILQSVHAADVGRVLNPMQVRGQLEGSVLQGIGWALTEKMVYDAEGRMINPQFRNYRIPAYADSPHTEVLFADTYDTIGPSGAKSAGEAPFDPVAPAMANAIRDAIGVRMHDLPMAPDRLYLALSAERPEAAESLDTSEPVAG
jgi:putative selenate reductase molybdopterin-binding subunit